MRAINESSLHFSLDSGSTKRLKSFRKRLSSDQFKVVFDDKVIDLVIKYALKPESVREQLDYLNNLKDGDGIPFARSIKQYSQMNEVWEHFSRQEKDSFRWAHHYQVAERIVLERYSKARLSPLTYSSDDDIVDGLTDLGTSTGWTSIVDGKQKKRDVISGSYSSFESKIKEAKSEGSFNTPMLPGVRTQCSGEFTEEGEQTGSCKHKTRPIWMVDVWTVIAERMWGKPLTEWLKSYKYSAVGKDDFQLKQRISSMRLEKWNHISIDYSKYDSSIPSWLIDSAFKVIKSAFKHCDEDLLEVLKYDFICKNLITATDVVYVNHGNPSGSGLTTIINGICNEIMTEAWASFLNMSNDVDYIIMGDDNLIYFNGKVDKGIIASYLLHNFGVQVNEDKTTIGTKGDDPEFLSRIWRIDGAFRHPFILLSKLAFPEKWRDYSQIEPMLVLYSYILAYPMGMRELIDVQAFLKSSKDLLSEISLNKALVKFMPYNVQLAYEHNGGILPHANPQLMSLRLGRGNNIVESGLESCG